MRTRGYPHFLRAWNYVAGINQGSGDAERYRHFSLGRHRAFAGTRDFEAGLPAGTAIGSGAAELVVLFLAAKYAGAQVENPRQVSAYRYPRQYGPGAPSFARAVLARGQLLVSGTASVVGHASMHRGDVLEQLRETHANLLSLMQCASRRHNLDADAAQPQALRIYLRHRADWQRVQREVQRLFGAAPIIALHGDICRADLDVEIEGVYTLRGGDRA
jgi:chorismate lyase/3-hydroxybenzoate synthase